MSVTFVGSLAFCGVMQPAAHMALHSSPSIVLMPGLYCMPCKCRGIEAFRRKPAVVTLRAAIGRIILYCKLARHMQQRLCRAGRDLNMLTE